MRVVHLHGGTTADVEVSFHPQITVVRGLHDPARRWCIDTLGHLAVGRGAEASGEVEASGIRFALTDTALSTLGLVVARNAVVSAADLRPSVTPSVEAGLPPDVGPVVMLGPGEVPGALGPGDPAGVHPGSELEPLADRPHVAEQPVTGAAREPVAPELVPAPEPEALPDPVAEVIDRRLAALRRRRLELHRLAEGLVAVDTAEVSRALRALDEVPVGTPVEGAADLADRWRDLQREQDAIELGTTSEERAAMAELVRAEAAEAEAEARLRQPQLTAEQVRRIEAAHAAYVEAGDRVERRFGGARAKKALADAEAEEARVLARFGFDSWVDYMLSTSKRAADPEMRREHADLEAARQEVQHCTAELDAIPGAVARRRRRAELAVRQDELSTEVAAVLGHQPVGPDVEAELRALRVASDRTRELEGLVSAMRAAHADPGPAPADAEAVAASARRFLDSVAHDAHRREELVTAVDALDVHIEALAEARAATPPVMPDLPSLPDMAEPPLGLLDQVAATPVHAVPQGTPAERTAREAGKVEQAEEIDEGSEPPDRPGNGLRSDPRDMAEADAFNAQTPPWLERVVGAGPTEASVTRDAAHVAPTGPGSPDPAASDEAGTSGELVEPAPDGAGQVGDEGVGDGVVMIQEVATEGVVVGAVAAPVDGPVTAAVEAPVEVARSPGPVDRQAVVDDVIWRAMVRIDACRSDGPAGFLPVVFDDPFTDLDADEVVEVLSRLARLTDLVQFVIVSDRPEIARWAHDLGPEHALVVG